MVSGTGYEAVESRATHIDKLTLGVCLVQIWYLFPESILGKVACGYQEVLLYDSSRMSVRVPGSLSRANGA